LYRGLAWSFASASKLNLKGVQFNKWKLTSCFTFTIGTCISVSENIWNKYCCWWSLLLLFQNVEKIYSCWLLLDSNYDLYRIDFLLGLAQLLITIGLMFHLFWLSGNDTKHEKSINDFKSFNFVFDLLWSSSTILVFQLIGAINIEFENVEIEKQSGELKANLT